MGKDKKKCCESYKKKGKMCGSCPLRDELKSKEKEKDKKKDKKAQKARQARSADGADD